MTNTPLPKFGRWSTTALRDQMREWADVSDEDWAGIIGPTRHRHWHLMRVDLIARARAEGYSFGQIAAALGRDRSTIQQNLKSYRTSARQYQRGGA